LEHENEKRKSDETKNKEIKIVIGSLTQCTEDIATLKKEGF